MKNYISVAFAHAFLSFAHRLSLHVNATSASLQDRNSFDGFNVFAYATVATLAICGLLVSFTLKYLDNVAKYFCVALSMLCVALLDSPMKHMR